MDKDGMKFVIAWTWNNYLEIRQVNRNREREFYRMCRSQILRAWNMVRSNEFNVFCRGASLEAIVGIWNLLLAICGG